MGVHWTVEHHGGKGWMRFQRRCGNGVPALSVACCMVDVTDANWTSESDGAFVFLEGQKGATFSSLAPLLLGPVPVIPVLLICTVEEKTCLLW